MIDYEVKLKEAYEKRKANQEKKMRRIERGYISGKILPNGATLETKPKGIQNWYSTRRLIELVTLAFDRNEKTSGVRVCYINNRHQLQIRGKHLRRLLKAMPNVKHVGSALVEEKKS